MSMVRGSPGLETASDMAAWSFRTILSPSVSGLRPLRIMRLTVSGLTSAPSIMQDATASSIRRSVSFICAVRSYLSIRCRLSAICGVRQNDSSFPHTGILTEESMRASFIADQVCGRIPSSTLYLSSSQCRCLSSNPLTRSMNAGSRSRTGSNDSGSNFGASQISFTMVENDSIYNIPMGEKQL